MNSIVSMEELLQVVADTKRIKDENASLQAVVKQLLTERTQREVYMAGMTAMWNVITVMGRVTDVDKDGFTLEQGGQSYGVVAAGSPCAVNDCVMVVGNLSREDHYEDPTELHIAAFHIVGVMAAKDITIAEPVISVLS